MIGKFIADAIARARDAIARRLIKRKVPPNALTACGMIANLAAGFLIGCGFLRVAATVIIFSGLFDILDGAVAKLSGGVTKFGSFLDSFLDRYSDCAIYIGIIIYFMRLGNRPAMAFSMSAMVGSVLVSYVRARAENLIEDCKVGFWARGERITYIIIGLFAGRIDVVMYVLAVVTHITVLQRVWHTYSVTTRQKPLELKNPVLKFIFGDFVRATPAYDIVAGIYAVSPIAAAVIEKLAR